MNISEFKLLAKSKYEGIEKLRSDFKFIKVIGKLKSLDLIYHSTIPNYHGHLTLEEVLFAAELEGRIFALLPALILKKPKIFLTLKNIPEDLKTVISEIRKGKAKTIYHGIKPEEYCSWITRIGHKKKLPSLIKSLRFSQDDLQIIEKIKRKLNLNNIQVIRTALNTLLNH